MTFYHIRIAVIPILLLSTGLGLVVWMGRMGLERQRASRMVAVVQAYESRQLDEEAARARLLECTSEPELSKWLTSPTLRVRHGAVSGLGLIGTTRSVPVLTRLLGNGSRQVRRLAEPALRQARRRSGDPDLDALLDRAEQLSAAGRTEEALEILDSYTRLQPDQAEAHYLYGIMLLEEDEIRPARVAFSKAIELDPTHFDAYLGRGICYLSRGRPRKAQADFLRAVEINPNMEEVRLLLEGSRSADHPRVTPIRAGSTLGLR